MGVYKPNNSTNYHYRFMVNGRIHTGSCRTTNKAQALRVEAKEKEDAHRVHMLGEQESITIKNALQRLCNLKKEKKTYSQYKTLANKSLGVVYHNRLHQRVQCFGFNAGNYLHNLNNRDFHDLIAARLKDGNKSQTIMHELNLWSQTIKLADRLNFKTPKIDFVGIRSDFNIKPSKGEIRYLTKDEELKLLEELDPKKEIKGLAAYEDQSEERRRQRQDLFDLTIVLLDVGGQHGEVALLKWAQIDLKEKSIELYRSKVSNRSILSMTDRVHQVFQRRYDNRTSDIYVFTASDRSEPRKYRSAAFKAACRRAGIEGVSFHKLRHTLATRIVQAGLSLSDVQAQLGHSTPQMSARYAHLAPLASSKRIAEALNKTAET